ncbi:hypothetical protein PC9H_011163 [Pleurotus ostreatus]|uniref:Uncharacterized protein n=1 Tax=Pleurotus ostreatus TaxID=5322 RepID=A0A8H7DPC4_PLEOS|nr:uncharacterized protein PC9H_011163 [Pleurotus ostreatus]KAF7422999.1 hypothetical protein PC9H_011163 [Pleurotus ostreatus]KAJ8691003.1 hypothetical protein PTI98_010619 [Pleurotus ostreatus]
MAAKRTHDLINEALKHIGPRTSKKQRMSRVSNEARIALENIEDQGKVIPQLVDVYRHPRELLCQGYELHLAEQEPRVVTSGAQLAIEVVTENKLLLYSYKKIISRLPLLPEIILEFRNADWDKWQDMVGLIAHATSQTRSNDSSGLRDKLEYFIVPRELNMKVARGWNHQWTAELLCPQRYRNKFLKDPCALMLKAQKGSGKMQHHTDWPAFLYDATEYDKTNPESGLFKNRALVLILRHILVGPSAVKSNTRSTLPRRCNASILGISDINGHLIAYAACQARFMLNAQTDWTRMDGKFDSSAFYDRITHYFKTGVEQGDANVNELLKWYQSEVFSGSGLSQEDEDSDSDDDESDDEDEDALIQRQRELRQSRGTNTGEAPTGATGNTGEAASGSTGNAGGTNAGTIDDTSAGSSGATGPAT